jgi:hypothetical protein
LPGATRSYGRLIPLEVFYLGTHQPNWLRLTDVPLCISRRRLEKIKRLPQAIGPWALDSGGFTELSLHGRWTITADQYVAEVRRYAADMGNLRWAAPMDLMCEPWILEMTGLSVAEHQLRTLENYLELCSKAPHLPWIPVLQGWTIREYLAYPRPRIMPVMASQTICGVLRQSSLIQPLGPGLARHNV